MKLSKHNEVTIFEIPNHKEIKPLIVQHIDRTILEHKDIIKPYTQRTIYLTDYDLRIPRTYANIVFDNVLNPIKQYYYETNFLTLEPKDPWFHVYRSNDYFNWHWHGNSGLSFIYYLEMPEDDMGTIFINNDCKFKEGDCAVIPSWLLHASPRFVKGQKIIISFNVHMYLDDKAMYNFKKDYFK